LTQPSLFPAPDIATVIAEELAKPYSRYSSRFDGETYDAAQDEARLAGQMLRVAKCMADGEWRTLEEIAAEAGDPEASVSARLRDLRKRKFGNFVVERRARGDRKHGNFEYRVTVTR
jgi:hypothetical protein